MLKSLYLEDINEKISKNLSSINQLIFSYSILRQRSSDLIIPPAICLTPKKITQTEYEQLKDDCLKFNYDILTLYNNFDKLKPFYKEYGKGDKLVETLMSILDASENIAKSNSKPIGLIIRNDFMFDKIKNEFIQVEFNNMSVGLGQLSTRTRQLTNHVYSLFMNNSLNLVESKNSEKQIDTFIQLFNLYGNKKAIVLEVMLDFEPNIFDSILNEKKLIQAGITVQRLKLSNINPNNYHIEQNTNKLFVNDNEVAIVYFRSLYDSEHFTQQRIDFFVTAECSKAIMLPNVKLFMIGIKLTQLLFSSEELLKKYDLIELKSSQFSKHYCPTTHISTHFDDDRLKMLDYVKLNKQKLILKSLNEGGSGIIITNNEMIEFVENESIESLKKVILAYRIQAPRTPSIVFTNHELKDLPATVSEISIYTSIILLPVDKKFEITYNSAWDYLLRTKNKTEIKGGMNLGFSFMDSLVYDS